MKIGNILNNLINEKLIKKDMELLKKNNLSTYPKIPTSKIFFHNVPDFKTINTVLEKGGNDLENNASKNFKLEKVNVKMIVPTQQNVSFDNLKSTENVGGDTNAELIKYGQFYFILDGHHRIANAILQGITDINAYVFNDGGINEGIVNLLDEDYPVSFSMSEFKSISSFAARVKYCEDRLIRLGSGSSRTVYQIDNEKVLKLAKNNKGLAQNEAEAESADESSLSDIVAKVFDSHENNLWIEMELASKLNIKEFKRITGFNWVDYCTAIHNYGIDVHGRKGDGSHKKELSKEIVADMWENEFTYGIFDYIGNYAIPVGDLMRSSSYGVVKRDGHDTIVLIDYGLNQDVMNTYYAR